MSQNSSSPNLHHSISKTTGKSIKHIMYLRIYSVLIFFITPLALVQEFFLLKSPPHTTIYPNPFLEFANYIKTNNLFLTYILFIIFMSIFLYIYLKPISNYLVNGTHEEQTRKKLQNPIILVLLVIISSSLSNIIEFIINYQYFLQVSFLSNLYNILYCITWQILLGFFLIYIFLNATAVLRIPLQFYQFEKKELKFFTIYQDSIFLAVQISMIILITLESINLIQQGLAMKVSATYFNGIYIWANILFFSGLLLTLLMLFIHQKTNQRLRTTIAHEIEELFVSGNLAQQTTYCTQDRLGYFISEYNTFVSSLKYDLTKVLTATNQLHNSNTSLRSNANELMSVVISQESMISSINLAAESTNKTIQTFADEVNIQYTNLNNELTSIEQLISGTDNIISVFKDIKAEHEQSQKSSQEGLKAVEASLDKSLLMQQRIQEITDKIREAGQETEGIDEVLKVIKNISEQTNLLSMSAAIEAAHGGSSGHGFAMVADEVRKLANMSHDAVDRIASRLSSITFLIHDSFEISLQSLELADSNSRISKQLNEAMQQANHGSIELTKITEEADPITEKQGSQTKDFKDVILKVLDFLQYIQQELRKESAISVTMSLNFNTMINNSKKVQSALYQMNNTLENLHITEQNLNTFIRDFSLGEENVPHTSKNIENIES